MIDTSVRRRKTSLDPAVAIIIAIRVNGVCADGRIRGKGAARVLIGKQDWIQTGIRRKCGFVFPKRFTTLRLGWVQTLRRGQAPDRTGIHCHDPAGMRVKSNVELAVTGLSRSAGRRKEVLIPWNARCSRVRSAEPGSAATAPGAR